jgi:dihydrolipoamide dehydrogenase
LNERGNGIKVDSHMRTSNENVYAIGDVTNIIQLAHIASHHGVIAAENIMGMDSKMEYSAVPSAVFLSPEMGIVGLCEKEAIAQGILHQVTKFPFSANGKAMSQGETKGFVKIISEPESKIILGAAVIGPGATDLIMHFSPLIMEKLDYRKLKHMIVAHPTTAEAIHEAILGIEGEAIHFA